MTNRTPRIVAIVVGAVTVIILGGGSAQARCRAPMILHAHADSTSGERKLKVDRGERITIEGRAWGDRCYDTGVPEGAHGVLGDPVTGIELFVEQAGLDDPILVAKGDADPDYKFVATFVVPAELASGAAEIRARAQARPGFDGAVALLDVSMAAPAATEDTVASFGPANASESEGADGEQFPGGWVLGVVPLSVAAFLLWRRRRVHRAAVRL